MNLFRRLILTLAGFVIFVHSISLYAVPVSPVDETPDTEMTEESQDNEAHLYAYDAVVPAIQYVNPFSWHYLGDVVVDIELEFQDFTPEGVCQHGYLDILFPRIISPNAP